MNKIQIIKHNDSYDYRESQKIVTDFEDKKVLWKGRDLAGDCPEDATLNRDITDAFEVLEIVNYLKDKDYEVLEAKSFEDRGEFDGYKLS